MEAMSVRNYRNNLSASFNRAERGERVLIKRKKQLYALEFVGSEDEIITPELQLKMEEARKEYKEGKTISCRNKEELLSFLDSL